MFNVSTLSTNLSSSLSNPKFEKEPAYYILKAPESMQKIWQDAAKYFLNRDQVKRYDNRFFSKWYQLKKLWSENTEMVGITSAKNQLLLQVIIVL